MTNRSEVDKRRPKNEDDYERYVDCNNCSWAVARFYSYNIQKSNF